MHTHYREQNKHLTYDEQWRNIQFFWSGYLTFSKYHGRRPIANVSKRSREPLVRSESSVLERGMRVVGDRQE